MNTDPIADFLTRIRNGISAKHRIVEIPSSNIKKEITRVLHEKGFITNYKFEDDSIQGKIKIALKYNSRTKVSAIEKIGNEKGYDYILDTGLGVVLYWETGDNILPLVKKKLSL